jgi:hypothetical protein
MVRWINTAFGFSWMSLFMGVSGVRVESLDERSEQAFD